MTVLAGPAGAEDLIVRGARVLDPSEGVDAVLDVRIDRGVITELGTEVDANGHRVVDAAGAWTRQVAAASRIHIPLVPTRHQLFVTEPLDGVRAVPDADGVGRYVLKLRPTNVAPGGYVLRLSVRDPESGATGRSELAVRVE